MKKVFAFLMAVLLAATCMACNVIPVPKPHPEESTSESKEESKQESTSESKEESKEDSSSESKEDSSSESKEESKEDSSSESKEESKEESYADPIVVDAETYTANVLGMDVTYVIPKIQYEKPGVSALNTQILDILHGEYYSKVKDPIDAGDLPTYGSMSYIWGCRNGYMSIIEFCPICASEGRDFFVFNLNLNEMGFTDSDSLLNAYGISKETFLARAKEIMAQTMYQNLKEELTGSNYDMRKMAESAYARILSDTNVAKTEPVIGEGGALMIQCLMGSLYGMETYTSFLPYDTEFTAEAKAFYNSFDFASAGKIDISVTDGEIVKRYYSEIEANCTYTIPKVVCPKGQEDKMNQAIRNAIDSLYGDTFTNTETPQYMSLEYSWAAKDNIVSIHMWGDAPYSSWTEHLILSFDVITGEKASASEVLALYNIYDINTFYEKAQTRMGSVFVEKRGGSLSDDPYTIEAFNYTVDMNNVRNAIPYIGKNSDLYFLGQLGMEAGSTYIWYEFPYEGTISSAFQTEFNKTRVIDGENIFVKYTGSSLYYSASFTLPRIICRTGSETEANKVLTAVVKDFLNDSLTDTVNGGAYNELNYSWGLKDHYVSVLFWAQSGPADHDDYGSVTIDLNTGKSLEDSQILALFGITNNDEYTKQVTDRMGTEYLEQYKEIGIDDLILSGLELTCEYSHVCQARPIIGSDGTLYIAAPLGTFAGSGIDWHVFPYKGVISDLYKSVMHS